MPESERQPPEEVSKSSIKREMTALQKIGETLVGLAQSQLDRIPLSDKLLEAINFARTLKTRESIRRQLQYIGKIMRQVDIEPIQAALRQIQFDHKQKTSAFHEIEQWRERLIAESDEAIQAYLTQHTAADRQQLRQLVRKAQHDRKTGKNTGAETALFRYLQDNK